MSGMTFRCLYEFRHLLRPSGGTSAALFYYYETQHMAYSLAGLVTHVRKVRNKNKFRTKQVYLKEYSPECSFSSSIVQFV